VEAARKSGEILSKYLKDPKQLVSSMRWNDEQASYDRLLVFGNHQLSLMALIWPPHTYSPIHYHRAWCTFGIHSGNLVETLYGQTSGQPDLLTPVETHRFRTGSWAYDTAEDLYYHMLGNAEETTALSFHIYGVPPQSLGKINCLVKVQG
jgi:predicted metal-dependent enzyme (double-stranded beta helix superfamily)